MKSIIKDCIEKIKEHQGSYYNLFSRFKLLTQKLIGFSKLDNDKFGALNEQDISGFKDDAALLIESLTNKNIDIEVKSRMSALTDRIDQIYDKISPNGPHRVEMP